MGGIVIHFVKYAYGLLLLAKEEPALDTDYDRSKTTGGCGIFQILW